METQIIEAGFESENIGTGIAISNPHGNKPVLQGKIERTPNRIQEIGIEIDKQVDIDPKSAGKPVS
jgi:hypothetical protein